MAKLISCILAVFLAAGCARPVYTAKSDLETAYMHGNVAKVMETVIDDPRSGVPPRRLADFDVYTEITYNRAGNIVLMESFRGPDSLHFVKEEFFYDPAGKKMVRSVSHNLRKNSARTLEYEYAARGNLTGESETTGAYSMEYGYDRRGYLREERNTAQSVDVYNEETDGTIKYRYDSRGRLTRIKGNPPKRYSYHRNGVVAEIHSGKDVVERYDERGNLVDVTNIIKRTDEKGREKGSFAASITAVYEYDDRGNWIKRTQMYEGATAAVTFREIKYY